MRKSVSRPQRTSRQRQGAAVNASFRKYSIRHLPYMYKNLIVGCTWWREGECGEMPRTLPPPLFPSGGVTAALEKNCGLGRSASLTLSRTGWS